MAKKKTKTTRRVKKTKYLSLRLQFSSENAQNSNDHIPKATTTSNQVDLLEKDGHDENMEYLLSASDDGATSLTGLLDSADVASSSKVHGGADELSPLASVTYVSKTMNLVQTALRSRERDSSTEERYVQYSEVVNDDQKRDHEEVSSRVGGEYCKRNDYHQNQMSTTTRLRRLSLKLDYQEIMSAWSDKGGFYVQSDFPQTVPDINDDIFSLPITNVGGGGGGLWMVPESNDGAQGIVKMEEVPQDGDHRPEEWEWKWKVAAAQREASVLRYKEKKRNRLFSKTVRYQVRKENAQNRPRVKGRFVKKS